MVLHAFRIVFMLVVISITVSFAYQKDIHAGGPDFVTLYMVVPVGAAFVVLLLDMFWRHKHLQVLSGLFFGVLVGLVIAYVLSLVLDLVVGLFPMPPVATDPGPMNKDEAIRKAKDIVSKRARGGATARPSKEKEEELRREKRRQTIMLVRVHNRATIAYQRYARYIRTVQLTKLLLGAAAVFICVSFVLQTKDDFRFVIPYVEFSREAKGARPLLLDTSVIIDGRIADMAETRILESVVIVPRFVLAELQGIADAGDKLRRNRGRRGLDVLNRLQGSEEIDIQIMDPHLPGAAEDDDVDAKLVALGEQLDGRIVTNDYNLNKIAQLRGVDVININDLANALKPIVLPGETVDVRIIKPGEEQGQGVGYLDDGTMVVAEQGREHVGELVTITVTSILQTSAGRMIFGRFGGGGPSSGKPGRT